MVVMDHQYRQEKEEEEEEVEEPVSPSGQYLNSSALNLTILAVLESEIPIDDSQILSLIQDVFLPINPRFSSIMVTDDNGLRKWKQVKVRLADHVNTPIYPEGMSLEYYDDCLTQYLSKIGMEKLPQTRPLWEIHIFKYPTSYAAGNTIFKLHHALGDGYSLMGVLLSCLQRADNASIPLTFPSRQSNTKHMDHKNSIFRCVPQFFSMVIDTTMDFGRSLLMSTLWEDDQSPIRSGNEGVEFKPITITTMVLSLDQLKAIKTNLEVSINDVITGIIFYGTRLYMQETSHDQLSTSNSNALVLFNTRNVGGYKSIKEMVKPKAEMPWGNYFTFLHVPIPKLTNIDSSNPLNFVLEANQLIKRQRNSSAIFLIGWLLKTLKKLKGPEATAQYVHSTLKHSSMAVTNMIGPSEKMALGNHPIKGLYFNVVGAPQSLSVTMVSYMGKLRISLGVEKGFIDPEKLKSCFQNAFEIMLKAATESHPMAKSKKC